MEKPVATDATGVRRVLESAKKAYQSFLIDTSKGGVTFTDKDQNIWIEEYIMKKHPTHMTVQSSLGF